MAKPIIFFLFAIFSISRYTCAQEYRPSPPSEPVKLVFYYNVNWELTSPEKAFFRREAFFDLYDMVFDGVYRDYDKENRLIEEGYYAHGRKAGMQTQYYEDQSIKLNVEYTNGDFIIWQKMSEDKKYDVTKGTGKFSTNYYYFFDWTLRQGVMQGEFVNGKKVGTWRYFNSAKTKSDEEHYQNGRFVDRVVFQKNDSSVVKTPKEIVLAVNTLFTESLAFDKSTFASVNQYFEKQISYPASFKREVTYPGGMKKLLVLLMQEVAVPEKNLSLVRIKINEHGQVMKTSIMLQVDEDTDDRVLKALQLHAKRFLPAFEKGKPIATTIFLPIASGDEWLKLLAERPAEWFLNYRNFWD